MRSVNKVILIGNATRDAELRHTRPASPSPASAWPPTGRSTARRRPSSTPSSAGRAWPRRSPTYVKKGDPLYVEGRLQYRSFQDEEGKERGVAEIVASDVQFLGRRRAGTDDRLLPRSTRSPASDTPATDEVSPDEIPF